MNSEISNEISNKTSNNERRLDGNAAAGLLREVFALEMTTAYSTCGHCGKSGQFGELMLYGSEIGLVLRCPECDHMLLCITHTPEGYWLDLRGLQVIRITATS
jgi:NAD-dependent SIR2 family protein deacetylase